MQAFVPKNRRPKFTLTLTIHDLNNVPLVTGTSYVKWHIPSYSTSAEHRGHTTKQLIRDHKVMWEYSKQLDVRLTVDKNGILSESEIQFEILQEYSPSARAERIVLGHVKLNLAEYCIGNEQEEGDEDAGEEPGGQGVTRRYLMRESKINSTLKITIRMTPLDPSIPYNAPPLKSAPVFGGIAGIMTSDAGGGHGTSENGWDGGTEYGSAYGDGTAHMPSMSSKAQESGKQQDMYRQNLAASWAMQVGELPPDKCVEDIFAGGDGWAFPPPTTSSSNTNPNDNSTERKPWSSSHSNRSFDGNGNGGEKRGFSGHHQRGSSGSTLKPSSANIAGKRGGGGEMPAHVGTGQSGVSGRTSIEQQVHASHDAKRARQLKRNEVNEIEEREDLRSWVVGGRVGA